MLAEFLARLAIALPLVCGLAVLVLVAVKRGWVRFPERRLGAMGGAPRAEALELVSVKAVSPTARLAVVRFAGAEHLVGVGPQSVVLLASAAVATGNSPAMPEGANG